MTNMPQGNQDFKWFGVTMATVCIPFFLLIGSLNTASGMLFWRSKWDRVVAWIIRPFSEASKCDEGSYDNPGEQPKVTWRGAC
jgi:hypothetical protein